MNDPRLSDSELIDETLRRAFEESWIHGAPLPIADCLPDPETDSYLPTLEELIHIQLEFAWKIFKGGSGSRPTSIELLLEEFPSLRNRDVMVRLLEQETKCGNRAGDTLGTTGTDDTTAPVAAKLADQATIPPGTIPRRTGLRWHFVEARATTRWEAAGWTPSAARAVGTRTAETSCPTPQPRRSTRPSRSTSMI
jgi:hypothetical protein